jgi:ribonuclease HI
MTDSHKVEISQGYKNTTNNRMELRAVIAALLKIKRPAKIVLHSDSTYICDAFNKGWLTKWKANEWKNSAKKRVKNTDLWNELLSAIDQHDIEWVWVKGHNGNAMNERVDRLANLAATSGNYIEDSGPTIIHA